MADVYDKIMHLVATEAMRMVEENPNGPGPGGCAGAVMATLLFAWAGHYGPHAESVIDDTAAVAKKTLREKRVTGHG